MATPWFWLKNNQAPVTSNALALSMDSDYGRVRFPVPWTSRVQTPVKRVPSGKFWSQPERYVPQTYGGPQH